MTEEKDEPNFKAAFGALQEMTEKHKMKWSFSYVRGIRSFRLELMGKRFHDKDAFECLKEGIMYFAKAEGIDKEVEQEKKMKAWPVFPPPQPISIQ